MDNLLSWGEPRKRKSRKQKLHEKGRRSYRRGKEFEKKAHSFLGRKGYKVHKERIRFKHGEIDGFASKGGRHFAVEVKNTETAPPAETNQKHRPRRLMQLVVVWFLFGVYNLYVSLNGIKLDWEAFSLLWSLPEWLRFAIPVEFALNVAAFIVSLVSIVIIYGLWTGKVWSDRLALGIPLSITIIDILTIVLYASAPAEVRGNLIDVSILGVTLYSAFATVMSWRYLRQAEVKEYMHSKKISLRDTAFVVFLIAITVGSIFIVQAIVERGQPAQPPNFIVINVDKTWNTDSTQLTCRVEVQNVGGDGWNTFYFRYMETEQSTGDFWTETKQWRAQLNNNQTQIITFVFNKHSTNAISYIVDWWFTY